MDVIFIRELRVSTLIGIYDWERVVAQPLEIDLEIGMASNRAAASDSIADTIDYGMVVQRIEQTLAEQRFGLLEALAEHLAAMVMNEFGAPWVRLSVAKIGVMKNVSKLGVRIERGTWC